MVSISDLGDYIGSGSQGSVWQHASEPDKIIKIMKGFPVLKDGELDAFQYDRYLQRRLGSQYDADEQAAWMFAPMANKMVLYLFRETMAMRKDNLLVPSGQVKVYAIEDEIFELQDMRRLYKIIVNDGQFGEASKEAKQFKKDWLTILSPGHRHGYLLVQEKLERIGGRSRASGQERPQIFEDWSTFLWSDFGLVTRDTKNPGNYGFRGNKELVIYDPVVAPLPEQNDWSSRNVFNRLRYAYFVYLFTDIPKINDIDKYDSHEVNKIIRRFERQIIAGNFYRIERQAEGFPGSYQPEPSLNDYGLRDIMYSGTASDNFQQTLANFGSDTDLFDDVEWTQDSPKKTPVPKWQEEVEWNAPAPKQTKVRFPRAKADKIVATVEAHIKPYVEKMMACGSYRRGAQMIGDIDFVVILKDGYTLPQILPPNQGINWVGEQKAQVIIDGEKVDFRVTTPEAWGATILYFTGPADFNIKYRWMAKKRGLKLSEYGLFKRDTDEYLAGATEQDIYDALGRPYRDPKDRKGFQRSAKKKAENKEKFYYHGTDMRSLDSILKEGIRPTDVEDSVWYQEIMDVSPHPYYYEEVDDLLPSVFVADNFQEAHEWAEEAGNTEIVVLKISSQVENLANFSDDGVGGWRTSETIPKEYILNIESFDAEEIRCCKECDKTTGLTTIQEGTYCWDCLPINLGAESSEEDFACTDYIIEEIKRIWYSPAQKDIKHWAEHSMAGGGLGAYYDGFDLPDGSELSEDTTKDEYFERMFDIFLERFEEGTWMYSDDDHGIMIQGDRVLYVPVGTPVNVDSLGNWENRHGDQYGVYGDKITSWLWKREIYAGAIFGHDGIDHMMGEEGKDFDRIHLTVWVPWEAVDWASTIAYNISIFWQENELCVRDKEPVYELNFSRNEVDEASLDKAMNAEEIVCSKCDWSWQRSEGGDDLFTCHKCGFDNFTGIDKILKMASKQYKRMEKSIKRGISLRRRNKITQQIIEILSKSEEPLTTPEITELIPEKLWPKTYRSKKLLYRVAFNKYIPVSYFCQQLVREGTLIKAKGERLNTWQIKDAVADYRSESQLPICPICEGYIPSDERPGAYPGATSRYDNKTEICSACGTTEAVGPMILGDELYVLRDEAEEFTDDPWEIWCYIMANAKDQMPPVFLGRVP